MCLPWDSSWGPLSGTEHGEDKVRSGLYTCRPGLGCSSGSEERKGWINRQLGGRSSSLFSQVLPRSPWESRSSSSTGSKIGAVSKLCADPFPCFQNPLAVPLKGKLSIEVTFATTIRGLPSPLQGNNKPFWVLRYCLVYYVTMLILDPIAVPLLYM